ncbi:hypothetical protein BaRGS_00038161 [Batillaria attramentaria]|uniref:Uncharacterized protein n=1 Tax=Batillaria attramentaria TaxID=370345 RepID=A0ABD0J6W2_9CAEN
MSLSQNRCPSPVVLTRTGHVDGKVSDEDGDWSHVSSEWTSTWEGGGGSVVGPGRSRCAFYPGWVTLAGRKQLETLAVHEWRSDIARRVTEDRRG